MIRTIRTRALFGLAALLDVLGSVLSDRATWIPELSRLR
jgi:hypothetical protein